MKNRFNPDRVTPKEKVEVLASRFRRFVRERDALSEALGRAVRERLEPGYLYPIEYDGSPSFAPDGAMEDDHTSHHKPIAAFLSFVGDVGDGTGPQGVELNVLCEGNITWRMDEAISDVSYMEMMLQTLLCDRRRRVIDNDTNREKLTR